MKILDKTRVFHILQGEIAVKLPEIVNWDDTNATPLGLRKNNIHILKCVNGITALFYVHAKSGRSGEISYEINVKATEPHCQVESIFLKHSYTSL